jgi:Spy/CpxP family protein refolding chaperone
MITKKWTLAAVLLLGVLAAGLVATAQIAGPPGTGIAILASTSKPTQQTLHAGILEMLQQLNLTPQQTEKINKIMANEVEQVQKAAKNGIYLTPEEINQIKAIHKQGRKDIAAVLTPPQKQQLKQLMQQRLADVQDEVSGW